jgi:mycothiol synthase
MDRARQPSVVAAEPEDRSEIDRLVQAATAADGVGPLSEHGRLHSARGGGTNLAVRDGDGRLAGFAHLDRATGLDDSAVEDNGDDSDIGEPAAAELVVDPGQRRRGVGLALVDALRREAGPGGLRVWAHGRLPGAVALAARVGAAEVRELRMMRRDLSGPDLELPIDAGLPADLRLRGFRVGADEDEWLRVNALAFAHHPEQGGWTIEDLLDREGTDWFDPAGFLLAEVVDHPGTIAGYHWTKQHQRAGQSPLGEVYVVGLDPAYQGRGLGSVLTLAGLRYLRRQGLDEVILYVDGDNTPAIATYQRLGFETATVDVMYALSGAAAEPAKS